MIAVIKSDEQYREVLGRVDALMDLDPLRDSPEGRELEVLALLVKDYERRVYPLQDTSPLTAIKVRMEQQALSPRDLVPFLGSRGRVSEVLAGKRQLSIAMIRSLHKGLGIPLEALVAEQIDQPDPLEALDWERFPIREMANRGWLNLGHRVSKRSITYEHTREVLGEFFGTEATLRMASAALHRSDRIRAAPSTDRYSLIAWAAYVSRRASRVALSSTFRRSDWGPDTLKDLRSLSRFDVGPRLAVQFLEDRGIAVDIVPHLPKTRLDGAAIMGVSGTPIIALTLRHDRLDNFWFTLFHELMHVLHHLHESDSRSEDGFFVDDLDVVGNVSEIERDADERAREALIPSAEWERSAVRYVVAPATVSALAKELGVAEAVVAGRVRYEKRNYRLLSQSVGSGRVRSLFPEVVWDNS